jgi:hypothetical protein
MTTPFKGKYTNFTTPSLKKRLYLMQAQRNTPLLDEEVREISWTNVMLTNWLARNSFGKVAALSYKFSEKDGTSQNRNNGFGIGAVNPTDDDSTENSGDFVIYGGNNANGRNDYPAVLYLKGWYLFLSSDIKYRDQSDDPDLACDTTVKEYPSELIPSVGDTEDKKLRFALRNDAYTKDTVAVIGAPGSADQVDVIYVEVTFDEVTCSGSDEEYVDPSLRDPVVANPTANRVRASVSFRVHQNWQGETDANIFDDRFFDDGTYDTGVTYIRAPLSLIRWGVANSSKIVQSSLVDLLTLHDKRVYPPEEITHRLLHGGYTERDVQAGRALPTDVDETWGATGCNEGIGTEALNSSSVTPRVLSKTGNFRMQSLSVAGVTGEMGGTGYGGTIQPNPEGLQPGETTGDKVFYDKLFLRGNDQVTIEKAREMLEDAIEVVDATGLTGPSIIYHTSDKKVGETGTDTKGSVWKQEYHEGGAETSSTVSELDYQGNLALGKEVQGHSGYTLDVGGSSNFDGNIDFRGDSNQFWKDMGVSGTADIFNMKADRVSYRYLTPIANPTTSPTVPYTQGSYLFWNVCDIEVSDLLTSASFVIDMESFATHSTPADYRWTGVKAQLRVEARSQPSTGTYELRLYLDQAHNLLKDRVKGVLKEQQDNRRVYSIYVGLLPNSNAMGFNVIDFKCSDISNTRLTCYGAESSKTWIPEGSIQGSNVAWRTYSKGIKSIFRAERYAYQRFVLDTPPSDPQNYKIAQREYPSPGSANADVKVSQKFHIDVKGGVNLDSLMSFDLLVNIAKYTDTSGGNSAQERIGISASNVVCSIAGTPGKGLIRSINVRQSSDIAGQRLLLEVCPYQEMTGSSTLVVEVSEDPNTGEGANKNPFVLLGRYDTDTDLEVENGSTQLSIGDSLALFTDEYSSNTAALVTNDRVVLKNWASLDMMGAGDNAPALRDSYGSVGKPGQVLVSLADEESGVHGGVAWSSDHLLLVDNIAALRQTPPTKGSMVAYVKGYYSPGDGGGGFFQAKGGTYSDDGGYIIVNPSYPRYAWFRQLTNNELNVWGFGAIPLMNPFTNTPVDRTEQIIDAIASAKTNTLGLLIPTGSVYSIADGVTLTFPQGVPLRMEQGTFFYYDNEGTSRPKVVFNGPTTIHTDEALTHPTHGAMLLFGPTSVNEVYPEWWYAQAGDPNASNPLVDSTASLIDMYTSLQYGETNQTSTTYLPNRKYIKVIFGKMEDVSQTDRRYMISDEVKMLSPTVFMGGAHIYITSVGKWTVRNTIEAPNKVLFVVATDASGNTDSDYYYDGSAYGEDSYYAEGTYSDGGYGYSCSSDIVSWEKNANPSINVTWFGMRCSDGSTHYASLNKDAVSLLHRLFHCLGSSAVYYFPPGEYTFMDSYGPIDFGDALLEMAPNAMFDIRDTSYFKISGFVGDSNGCKFIYQGTDASVVNFPIISGGDIHVEWFRTNGFSDTDTLKFSIGSLLRSVEKGYAYSGTYGYGAYDYAWLTGEGRTYAITEDLIFSAGKKYEENYTPFYGYGAGIKDVSLNFGSSGFVFQTSEISDNPYSAVHVEGWRFSNMVFGAAYYNPINLVFANNAIFEKCQFEGGVFLDTFGSDHLRHASNTTRIVNCALVNSGIRLSSGSIQGCSFDYSDSSFLTNLDKYAIYLLYSCNFSGNRVTCTPDSPEIPLYNTVSIGDRSTETFISNCQFYNSSMTINKGSGVSVIGNSFVANSNYTPNTFHNPIMSSMLGTFITLEGSPSGDRPYECIGLTITGNRFFEKSIEAEDAAYVDNYSDIYNIGGAPTYLTKATVLNFEAIAVKEDTYYNHGEIWDVVVKDNTGTRGINIRATELTEMRMVMSEGISSTTTFFNVPRIHGSTGEYTVGLVRPETSRRLFGYPQGPLAVTVSARDFKNNTDYMGTLSGSCRVVSNDSANAYWRVYIAHAAMTDNTDTAMTWYPGCPSREVSGVTRFYDLVIRVTFKTYKERMSSAIGTYLTDNPDEPLVRLNLSRSGETLNRM